MSFYLWVTVITAVTFFLVIFLFFQKYLSGKDHGLSIVSVILLGVFACAGLYILSSMQGTQIVSSSFATEYEIKTKTFKTSAAAPSEYKSSSYAFYTENGVKYQIHGSEILKKPDDVPAFIGLYTCEAREGFSWCYFKRGKVLRYTLTALSHDGNAPTAHGQPEAADAGAQ